MRWMGYGIVWGLMVGGAAMWGQAGPPSGVIGGVVSPQSPTVAGPSGTVTGRVVAQDTQRAVRFAAVLLQAVPGVSAGGGDTGGGGRLGGVAGFGGGGGVNLRTDVEGSFTATGVAAGDYYVTASAPGFVAERALLQEKVAAGADPAMLLAGIPVVHVAADGTSSTTVTLVRGGAIGGKVVWEDGSAAAGVGVTVLSAALLAAGGNPRVVALPQMLQGIQSAGGNANYATTDDRGMFRLTGLTTGDYVVQVTVMAPMQFGGANRASFNSPILVYAPGVFHWAEAKPVNVREGDERNDVQMVIDLRGTHTVSGHASSATVGVNVASGNVTLRDAADPRMQLTGSIAANGDFTVLYVPAGNYTMTVTGSSRVQGGRRGGDSNVDSVGFQVLTTPLVVGDADVRGMAVSLTPVASGKVGVGRDQ